MTLALTPTLTPCSGSLHRGRRAYLRGALRELAVLLEDQPGLLGPKVGTGERGSGGVGLESRGCIGAGFGCGVWVPGHCLYQKL